MEIENINLNLLKTFYNVAKEGNITKTAEKHFTSQPAVSRSIKQLEEIYNSKLFYRTLNGVELTEKGTILFNSVEKIFENLNQTAVNIKEVDGFEKSSLAIGVPSQIGGLFLFEPIAKFHKLYPNVEITMVSKSTSELLKLLQNHEVDFIVDTSPITTKLSNIEILPILKYENCFFVNNKFPTNIISSIKKLNDLQDFPLILPIPNTANRNALNELLKAHKITFNNILNIHTSEMIISAVKKDAGVGYAIKNLIESEVKSGELTVLDIEEKLPQTEICLAYKKNKLSKVSQFFILKYLKIFLICLYKKLSICRSSFIKL